MHSFSERLLSWHEKNRRDLPWKADRDPYRIWVSEIILQQTRVSQGLPYFERFIQTFPTLSALADAPEDLLMQVWQGLGYYSRARNMQITARHIYRNLNNQWPRTYRELLTLKGIGPYTAAAIASFAFDEPVAVVDGNVVRILSRIFGIDIPFQKNEGKKKYQELADRLLDQNRPAEWNQAIMDFGALQCTPGIPDCSICPFSKDCKANLDERIDEFPPRMKKTPRKIRYFSFLVLITPEHQMLIRKRTGRDIWQSLHEFPMVETGEIPSIRELHQSFSRLFTVDLVEREDFLPKLASREQLLSHQVIRADFYLHRLKNLPTRLPGDFFLVDYKNLCNFAFPKITDWFIREKIIPLMVNTRQNDQ